MISPLKKSRISLPSPWRGSIYIQSTHNNTIITLVDAQGRVKAWSSGGSVGLRNSRKSTVHAAELAAQDIASKAQALGISMVSVHMRGLGFGKQKAVKALQNTRLTILELWERTSHAHNGCRAPRKRRV
jgi:small subunit ribosomal protein S11